MVTKSGLLWDTSQQEAIEKGNLIHNIMAQIKTNDDLDVILDDFTKSSIIDLEQTISLKKTIIDIIEHPKLKDFYTLKYAIYNERDIITKNGLVLRPDRVVINAKNEAIIIDYKTGLEDKKHRQQLQTYQDVLEEMDVSVKKKILIYINDDILVKEI